jgi:hypothetical protein
MWFSLLVQLFLMLDVNAVRIAFDFHFSKTGQWRLPGAEPGDVQRVQPVNWVACSDSASPDVSWGDVVQGFCTRGLFLMHGVYAASARAGRYRGGRDSPKEVYVLSFDSTAPRALSSFRLRLCLLLAVVAGLLTPQAMLAEGPEAEVRPATPARLLSPIDEHALVTLRGHVRTDLTRDKDLGAVEDGMPLRLSIVVQRSAAQQADLDNLLARQQQPTAAEYHKWLTPKAFGARFGAAPADLAKLSGWLESHGLRVRSVLNNGSIIDFEATAGQVRETFHTEIHNFNIQGGKYAANVQDPKIPAALAPVVASIYGLSKIPPMAHHTKTHQAAYDAQAHRWHDVQPDGEAIRPDYNASPGYYLVSPQDLYTIYNINPVFTRGQGGKATVAVVEQSDIQYGTVDTTPGICGHGRRRCYFPHSVWRAGHAEHACLSRLRNGDLQRPWVDPDNIGEDEEASLDAEWANATAPSANLIFMSCDQSPDNGIFTSLAALVDNNLADVMSISYGSSELNFPALIRVLRLSGHVLRAGRFCRASRSSSRRAIRARIRQTKIHRELPPPAST